MAFLISASLRGDPVMIVSPSWGVSEEGSRMRAVILWPRERATEMISRPVRPEAPRRRMCIFGGLERFLSLDRMM